MAKIEFNQGNYKTFDLYDSTTKKKLGEIIVDLTDPSFVERVKQCQRNIENILKKDNFNVDMLKDMDAQIRKEIDTLFDAEVSKAAFGNKSTLALKNGKALVQRFLEAMVPEIKKAYKEEFDKAHPNVNKYTSQYKRH